MQPAQLFQEPLDAVAMPVTDDGHGHGTARNPGGGRGAGTYNLIDQRTDS